MERKVLVTGGAGFIGSNFLRLLVPRYQDLIFINIDKLTYAANLDNLKEISGYKNYYFIHGDIGSASTVNSLFRQGIDYVVHFAAESHVDNSIKAPQEIVFSNITGCFNLLEAARAYGLTKFLQVSTDEVYGSIEGGGLFQSHLPWRQIILMQPAKLLLIAL